MTRKAKPLCPVCGKDFKNAGGRDGHLKVSKDAAHVAHRAQPLGPSNPAPPADPSPPLQQEAKVGETVQVSFEAATPGGPLLPAVQGPAAPASPTQKAAAFIIKPGALAPIIEGGVAVMCNGFFLRAPGDGQLTPTDVASTGVGMAVENAVRFYFPDLPWDHPAVLLFIASAGLAGAVAAKKAPKKPKAPKIAEKAKDAAKDPPAPAPVVETPPDPAEGAAPKAAPAPVDDYWVGIQAQAGGAPMEVELAD